MQVGVETSVSVTMETGISKVCLNALVSVLFQDKGWSRPVLDSSPGPVITEALMPESPAKFPHHLPSAGTANPQENERVPHVQDFVSSATRSRVFSL